MITKCAATLSRIRRWISPTEWFVRWFRLPKEQTSADDRGLLLIQIDGLGRGQLEAALHAGHLPFLRSLLDRERYEIRDLYSGLPASTPSVQGELFYGVRCAVPAFGFQDHRNGQLVRMFSQETAMGVEQRISGDERGLLRDGSSYCNIYGGGARDTHFCASSLGWAELMRGFSLLRLLPFVLWHAWSIVHVVGLLVVEFFLACFGFVKGALTKQEYWQELLMIPARVVVVILLREMATIGATLDVTRGVPIVHLNFLGYDEQAHRRGPKSNFAHWTLKGIDNAVRRLWRAAHRSGSREYDVWIYSDHRQVTTTPFDYVTGNSIANVVAEVEEAVFHDSTADRVDRAASESEPSSEVAAVDRYAKEFNARDASGSSSHDTRASWLSAGWLVGKLFGEGTQPKARLGTCAQVAALGPVGLVYLNRKTTIDQRLRVAEELVRRGVPVVFLAKPDTTLAITAEGQFDVKR